MSLFPEVDDEIVEIKREFSKYLKEIEESSTMYTPSNGTEGIMFVDRYCSQCPNDDGEDKLCPILAHYVMNGFHNDIREDKNGAFLCLSSPMFKKIAREKFNIQRKIKCTKN